MNVKHRNASKITNRPFVHIYQHHHYFLFPFLRQGQYLHRPSTCVVPCHVCFILWLWLWMWRWTQDQEPRARDLGFHNLKYHLQSEWRVCTISRSVRAENESNLTGFYFLVQITWLFQIRHTYMFKLYLTCITGISYFWYQQYNIPFRLDHCSKWVVWIYCIKVKM